MADPFVGRIFGKYQVLRKIGQGGMGVVYRAQQMSLNRTVAIKMLPKQMALDEDFTRRFRQEAELIAALDHENIVRVYDVDRIEDIYCIVMEYVEGQSLRQLRKNQRLDSEAVRAFGIPVARALEYAHRRGIVHRDVKSGNVMVTTDGRVKLMDFGIAKTTGSDIKTITGAVLGTPEYMAPEQARSGAASVQTDVYSLGVLLYELATDTMPFTGEDAFSIAFKHVSEPPRPPRQIDPTIPLWLEQTILKAMAKDPGDRHPSAQALENELVAAGEEVTVISTGSFQDPLEATRAQISKTPPAAPPTGIGTEDLAVNTTAPTMPGPGYRPPAGGGGAERSRGSNRGTRLLAIGGLLAALALATWAVARIGLPASGDPPMQAEAQLGVASGRIESWIEEARGHLEGERFGEVIRLTNRVLEADPGRTEAFELRSEAARRREQAEALELAEAAEPPPPARRRPAAGSRPPPSSEPPPAEPTEVPVDELWRQALELRNDKEIHTLAEKLEEILERDPQHLEALRWSAQIEGWIEDHRQEMTKLVERQLEALDDAFRERDRRALAAAFGLQELDPDLDARLEALWSEYPRARLSFDLGEVEVHDRQADFATDVVLQVKERKVLGSWKTLARHPWRARLIDDWGWVHLGAPFPAAVLEDSAAAPVATPAAAGDASGATP